ncbi:MAG: hypothetical protein BGO78_13050 [Chloroflexi bacterium 44-23]|nr:MAG: hypothetical protein BGO78_13050 [Chloroflexi bacterium 44-23]
MRSELQQAGSDPKAFTELYQTYFRRVYQYMRYRCDNDACAEDLTALVFERILRNLQRYQQGETPIDAWIFKITANCFTDWYRRQKKIVWLPWHLFQQRPAGQAAPEDQLLKQEQNRELHAALEELTERERNLIAWRFGACLNNRQIADITHLSEQNVAVIIFRALRKLKEKVQHESI